MNVESQSTKNINSKLVASGKLAQLRQSLLQPGPTSNRSIGKPVLRIAEPSRAQSPLSLNSNASSSRSSNREYLPYLANNMVLSSPQKKMWAAKMAQQPITPGRSIN